MVGGRISLGSVPPERKIEFLRLFVSLLPAESDVFLGLAHNLEGITSVADHLLQNALALSRLEGDCLGVESGDKEVDFQRS